MNNSLSVQPASSTAINGSNAASSKSTYLNNNNSNKNKNAADDIITINEKVNLTKQQHQVLKTICDTYQMSRSEYMQQALVEAMRFDIEEGNLCDVIVYVIHCTLCK